MFDVLQPEMRRSCVVSEVLCAIKIGLLCVQHRPEMRPSMSQVVTMLSGNREVEGFMVKSNPLQSDFKDLLGTIHDDISYPTLQRLAKDSTLYPLISLDSQASSSYMSWKPSTESSIELSGINNKMSLVQ